MSQVNRHQRTKMVYWSDFVIPSLPTPAYRFLQDFRDRHHLSQQQVVLLGLRALKYWEDAEPQSLARSVNEVKEGRLDFGSQESPPHREDHGGTDSTDRVGG
jgi:hypothetical protein